MRRTYTRREGSAAKTGADFATLINPLSLEVLTGCKVENASYGLTQCAECALVSALHTTGGGRLLAVACVDARGEPLMACGRCRQLLWEHGGAACLVATPLGVLPMSALLPQAFGPDDLAKVTG